MDESNADAAFERLIELSVSCALGEQIRMNTAARHVEARREWNVPDHQVWLGSLKKSFPLGMPPSSVCHHQADLRFRSP